VFPFYVIPDEPEPQQIAAGPVIPAAFASAERRG
jgi:hypothetical protein